MRHRRPAVKRINFINREHSHKRSIAKETSDVTIDTYSVTINKPIELVFNYVTTPAWWPIYHPTSKKVAPPVNHSLQVRESTVETCILDSIGFLKFVIY